MKLGCLPYLNVKPLVYGLEQGINPLELKLAYAPPSKLAKMLEAREIEAAPVSSFAVIRNDKLKYCSSICISSQGPVDSVLLFCKTDIENIHKIALDPASLSAAAMVKIILSEAYGITPKIQKKTADSDAFLLIGDAAMLTPKNGYTIIDIATEWKKLTGLPAVFALWAGYGITEELEEELIFQKTYGLSQIHQIAYDESFRLGLSEESIEEYLTKRISYDFGEDEKKSFDLFKEKCHNHKLV